MLKKSPVCAQADVYGKCVSLKQNQIVFNWLTLCLPSSTFGTNTVAMHNELNPTGAKCNISRFPKGCQYIHVQLPALALLLTFQLGYLGVLI